MKLVVFISLLVAAKSELLQSYSLPNQGGGTFTQGTTSFGGQTSFNQGFSGQTSSSFGQSFSGQSSPSYQGTSPGITSCGNGQVLHVDGRCVTPEVMRNLYVYTVPQQPQDIGPRPHVPLPKVEHNIVFVRLPENVGGQEPIVVPPPQQNNIVYILKKKTAGGGQQVINVPAPPKKNPEVYFVNYGNGENPTLPGGIDLQTALANAAHQGQSQVIGGGPTTGTGGVTIGGTSGTGGGNYGSTGGSVGGGDIISGGTISGGIISGGTISGGTISGGSISTPSGLYTSP